MDDKVIIVEGEEDMFVSHLSSFRYIEADEETLEIPFQALEIAVVSRRREQSIYPWEKMSKLIKGRNLQGWGKLLEIPENNDRLGLGYKLADEGLQNTTHKKPCPLQETFHNVGYKGEDQVVVIEEEEGVLNLVCHCSPNTTLINWKAIKISEMIYNSK